MHYTGNLEKLLHLTANFFSMRSFLIILLVLLSLASCKTTRYVPATSTTRTGYIETYSDIAIREMKRTGVPASIKMAQAILESGDGNSRLARQANNHFGVKCHDWSGRRIYHDDDERNECFRRYTNPEESFRDHSDFLTGRSRYAGLFELDPYDYKSWAKGLKKAGYATNPSYDRLLIRIIEDNELYKLDEGAGLTTINRQPAETGNRISSTASDKNEREVFSRNRIRYIIAENGDNYESLTREMGLMRWELARYNDMPDNYKIQPGDMIYLQPKRIRAEKGLETHTVSQGETMRYISQLYGVRLNRLLERNFMTEGDEPSAGDIIFLRKQGYRENSESNPGVEYDL